MNVFYHSKGLGPEVVSYIREDRDWLLTRQIPGEDCLDRQYLEDPRRLCDITSLILRQLHETDPTGCPVDRTAAYIAQAKQNHRMGNWDDSFFPDNWGYDSAQDARDDMEALAPLLRRDTLIHGDYCLPNIILQDWKLSGFIDLGQGGLGDRHIDLFWGIWSLAFNLKTNRYRDRFLHVYGRDAVDPEILRRIGSFEVFL
jgi:kanamycin kinase